jgi:peptide chain release factor 1
MFQDKLQAICIRFEEVSHLITDPAVVSDSKRYVQLSKEYKELKVLVDTYQNYLATEKAFQEAQNILQNEQDAEFREMARAESTELAKQIEVLQEEVKQLLIPKDPEDDKNAMLEIRAGTGGDEACIFVQDVMRMYTMYLKAKGYQCTVLNSSDGSVHGLKEVIIQVEGENAYGILKYESGVHRVQRVPETESQGRVHTSAITVAVMPEVEEFDFEINMTEVRRDVFRASGAGGQHVNRTESAVRLTHLPTGTTAECQDGRSQGLNYEKALQVLRSRLYEQEMQKRNEARANQRKLLVSTGDRSAKIRTYNYPQGRVTDHRINLTLYNLEAIMNGNIQEILDQLKMTDNAEKMKDGENL